MMANFIAGSAQDFTIYQGGLLGSSYEVQAFLGQGSFGKVVKCVDTILNIEVAIKITKNKPMLIKQVLEEIKILKKLKHLDPDKCNIVRWNKSFFHEGLVCLEFELLDLNLNKYMKERDCQVMSMDELRPVLHQLTTALLHLEALKIIHADIKPENIMVVDRRQHPLQVKLIDFGLAHHVSDAVQGLCVQSLWYRAPEVILGLVFSEKIDMWSVGLVAAELALGCPLFPGNNEYDIMKFIVDTVGQPPDYQLYDGQKSKKFFIHESRYDQLTWRLKGNSEKVEVLNFLDLLKKMLQVDKYGRIIPLKVLEHPFFTEEQHRGMNIKNLKEDKPAVTQQLSPKKKSPGSKTVTALEEAAFTDPENVSTKLEGEDDKTSHVQPG
ncbi:homeodomain-interacting protein kinase 2-like [Archocentrus centrarchus]|uniref:homeodomain-interacting protein kinase 2-like n=1 Tax=Archocentrus centrarchus TaxID=63155 RepID=UPI0011E9C312|nr:homeodomain-interacting protein kinase 2-like [Archocentrus centrarchus]